jgi:pre-mRNA-splicing factor ATP-dependent RNA helicase DHX15/PRP43
MSRAKKPRTDRDPASNPYLAHMYEGSNGNSDGYGYSSNNGLEPSTITALSTFKRHQTTAAQADAAERATNNPFNNKPLSKQYFNILKTRQDLPVHKQRYVDPFSRWYLTDCDISSPPLLAVC